MIPAPLGVSSKPFKKDSGLADGDPHATKLYAIKGSYNEFYKYHIASNTWATETSLPLIGRSSKKKKIGEGTKLAYAAGKVYCIK